MTKNLVQYQADIDYEATIEKFRALHSRHGDFSFDVTGGRGGAGAQIVLNFRDWNATMNIYARGLIQIRYATLPNLKKCVQILEQHCVPVNGKFTLKALGPDDPLDRSFELTRIHHWQHSDTKYAMARVPFYVWWDHETEEYIYRIPDREGRVNVPEGPYIYQCCIPISIHVIDKDDEKGNRIITAEKLRWKAIQELKRVVREHPRFKPKKKI